MSKSRVEIGISMLLRKRICAYSMMKYRTRCGTRMRVEYPLLLHVDVHKCPHQIHFCEDALLEFGASMNNFGCGVAWDLEKTW